jgi:HlyD family secretion protein
MKKRLSIILLAVIALGAVAGWLIHARLRAEKKEVLQLYANVDIREVNLGFRVSGRLLEVLHDEGDALKAGEVVARLDTEPYRRELEEVRGQVGALQARLQLLQTGNRPQEIAQARATVREREVTAQNAERVYKRQEELLGTKAVSVQERDDAEAKYREAEARLKSAREQLNLLESGFRVEEIEQAKADLARAEAIRASAELRLEDTVLKSPSDGILLTRAQEPGAILQPSTTVLTLSLSRPVWVRAYVHEPDLGLIHPGMKVTVHTDSHPDKTYAGQIGFISERAEFTPKNVETTELRTSLVYRLRIVIDNPDDGLRQGMPVTATIKLGNEGSGTVKH